jgi:hypothetical protein
MVFNPDVEMHIFSIYKIVHDDELQVKSALHVRTAVEQNWTLMILYTTLYYKKSINYKTFKYKFLMSMPKHLCIDI